MKININDFIKDLNHKYINMEDPVSKYISTTQSASYLKMEADRTNYIDNMEEKMLNSSTNILIKKINFEIEQQKNKNKNSFYGINQKLKEIIDEERLDERVMGKIKWLFEGYDSAIREIILQIRENKEINEDLLDDMLCSAFKEYQKLTEIKFEKGM